MNFYSKMLKRLNESGIYLEMNSFPSVYVINGQLKLGKKYKPLLVKLVNHLCAVAELRKKNYGTEVLTMRSILDYNAEDRWTKLSVYVYNMEGEEIFDFVSVAGSQRDIWYMFKYLLKEFNRWLYTFE